MNILMLELLHKYGLEQRGDTLIEVTIALAILSMVLLSSAAVATTAFRMGQTARERTTLVEAAQEQMEALHSFRDNHTWTEFQNGFNCGFGGYCGVASVTTGPAATSSCTTPSIATKKCFYMQQWPAVGSTGWVPVAGTLMNTPTDPHSTKLSVPTSIVEISLADESLTASGIAAASCDYDFELHYSFAPLGTSQMAYNQIKTRLVNLKYTPQPGGCLTP
jgi:prepilin-type N-terminal cleavage/methylation domain-containing protein